MSYDSAPRICPRCRGRLFEGFDGEYECLQCGCVVYVPDPSPSPYLREPLEKTQPSTPPLYSSAPDGPRRAAHAAVTAPCRA